MRRTTVAVTLRRAEALCVITTLFLVVAGGLAVQAQTPANTPVIEPSSTPPVASGRNQALILIVHANPDQTPSIQELIKSLESSGASMRVLKSSDEAASDASGITVELTVKAAEPYAKVKELIAAARSLGVSRFHLKQAAEGSSENSAIVTGEVGLPHEKVRRVAEFLSTQQELRLLVKPLRTIDAGPITPAGKSLPLNADSADETETTRIFYLENANAASTADVVAQLFKSRSIAVTADPRTNVLLVRGKQDVLDQVEAIVKTLDRPDAEKPGGATKPLRSGYDQPGRRITSTSAGSPAELKKRYEGEEQKAAWKAAELRELLATTSAQDPRIARLRTELRAAVASAFTARQQLHLAELAEFQNRAVQIQRTIEQRAGIQDQIIDRRMEDLLNPNLRWDSEPLIPAQPAGSQTPARRLPGKYGLPGGSESSRSNQGNRPSLFDPTAAPSSRSTPNSDRRGKLLSDAVREFNERSAQDRIGKDQPPLTDDEVVAAIRWAVSKFGRQKLSAAESVAFVALSEIAQSRMLPDDAQLAFLKDFEQNYGYTLTKWTIVLRLKRAGESSQHLLREQFICGDPGVADLPPPDLFRGEAQPGERPLAAAIQEFNLKQRSSEIGRDQPPITEDEVIAALRWWKTKRNEVDLTNEEFQGFQAIADTRILPKEAEFEVLTGFRPNQEFEFDAWSVRIRMPRLSKPGTYAFTIRDRWIHSRQLGERQISWGPAAANGLQAGVVFEPTSEQYIRGQQVHPTFFFRNIGSQTLSTTFPRLMTRSHYNDLHAVDDAGREIAVHHNPGVGGPVGWLSIPLSPGQQHEMQGPSIVLGEESGFETAIRARPGQACRVRFTVPNFGERDAQPIQTGEVLFTLVATAGKSSR
jgi:hypothetical protein